MNLEAVFEKTCVGFEIDEYGEDTYHNVDGKFISLDIDDAIYGEGMSIRSYSGDDPEEAIGMLVGDVMESNDLSFEDAIDLLSSHGLETAGLDIALVESEAQYY